MFGYQKIFSDGVDYIFDGYVRMRVKLDDGKGYFEI